MTDDLMTIRQMCEAYEVTPRTLRFYEAKELLSPIREGQKRWFTKRDRARLTLILRGKRFGFALEDIRQLLDLYAVDEKGQTQLRTLYDMAKKRVAEMEAQRDELTVAITDLKTHIAWGESQLAEMGGLRTAAE